MSYESFCSATFREINNVVQAHIEKEKDEIKLAWVTARYVAWWGVQPHDSKRIYMRPENLGLFDFEKGNAREFRELTEAEKKQLARWDREEAEKWEKNK